YAAANTFLDALAADRRARGVPGHSLAWGLWTDEAGQAAGLASASVQGVRRGRLDHSGLGAVTPTQGMALFEAALRRPEAHLVPVPLRLHALRQGFAGLVPPLWRALVATPRRAVGAGTWAQSLRSLTPVQREAEVLGTVRVEVARVLSLPGAEA